MALLFVVLLGGCVDWCLWEILLLCIMRERDSTNLCSNYSNINLISVLPPFMQEEDDWGDNDNVEKDNGGVDDVSFFEEGRIKARVNW